VSQEGEIIFPWDSEDAVRNMGIRLAEACPGIETAAIVMSRNDAIARSGKELGIGLPGNADIVGSALLYFPQENLGLAALNSSNYLLIRALKSAGGKNIVLYMPALPLDEGLPGIVAVRDHIDMLSRPPHRGVDPLEGEERFFPMNDAYDINTARAAMDKTGLAQSDGVLLGVGPGQFDSPAGRESAKHLGAGLMSLHIFTECLVARRAKLNVIACAETSWVAADTIVNLINASI
jgi:hypothetical protein